MRAWLVLLAGLLIWTAHFLGIYIAASLFPGTTLARWLTAILTLIALGVLAAVTLPTAKRARSATRQDLSRWLEELSLLACALAAVAILYQGLPSLTAR